MKCVPAHRSSLAWMLAGLILLGALACSFGHGQMLHALMPGVATDICGAEADTSHAHAGDQASGTHGLFMQLAVFDCAYASKLTTAVPAFAALAWLLRVLRRRALMPEGPSATLARHDSPGRIAQAP